MPKSPTPKIKPKRKSSKPYKVLLWDDFHDDGSEDPAVVASFADFESDWQKHIADTIARNLTFRITSGHLTESGPVP